jgi:hypothetical protein
MNRLTLAFDQIVVLIGSFNLLPMVKRFSIMFLVKDWNAELAGKEQNTEISRVYGSLTII